MILPNGASVTTMSAKRSTQQLLPLFKKYRTDVALINGYHDRVLLASIFKKYYSKRWLIKEVISNFAPIRFSISVNK